MHVFVIQLEDEMSLLKYLLGLSVVKPNIEREDPIDDTLLVRVGQDDVMAYEELYMKTERILYSYVLSLTKHHDDALDIMHDTYIKIKSAAHLYKPMGKPMAWIFTIAKNLAMTHFNKQSRQADMGETDVENTLEFSYVSDPIDRMVLQSALKILSEEESQIILLYAVNGLKHKEIAENLNLPQNTVISKYNRGLKKLRNFIEKEGIQ